jgi:hypothetical protein
MQPAFTEGESGQYSPDAERRDDIGRQYADYSELQIYDHCQSRHDLREQLNQRHHDEEQRPLACSDIRQVDFARDLKNHRNACNLESQRVFRRLKDRIRQRRRSQQAHHGSSGRNQEARQENRADYGLPFGRIIVLKVEAHGRMRNPGPKSRLDDEDRSSDQLERSILCGWQCPNVQGNQEERRGPIYEVANGIDGGMPVETVGVGHYAGVPSITPVRTMMQSNPFTKSPF